MILRLQSGDLLLSTGAAVLKIFQVTLILGKFNFVYIVIGLLRHKKLSVYDMFVVVVLDF